jgi:CDGSH iron-sulfur domain-containing protein 3
MSTPTIARKLPIPVDVEAGKDYFWCACGDSKNQPFCDGSHKGTEFVPLKWTATETEKTFFCACKHTANAPFCDGTHGTL